MMMKPQHVARSIVKGILSGKRIVTIDWRFRILVFLWRLIPSCLWVRLKIG
jgi:short-subunit dehydrogenase